MGFARFLRAPRGRGTMRFSNLAVVMTSILASALAALDPCARAGRPTPGIGQKQMNWTGFGEVTEDQELDFCEVFAGACLTSVSSCLLILSSKGSLVRKLRKVDQADAGSRKAESEDRAQPNREGYLCSARGFAAGLPRVCRVPVSEAQAARHAQHFGNLRFRFRGRRSILSHAMSRADFVAGATLSQGGVQISWQAQRSDNR